MAEEEDGRFVGPDEDGADEDFKVVRHVFLPVGGSASMLKGEEGKWRKRIEYQREVFTGRN